jgi:hypothetical protein
MKRIESYITYLTEKPGARRPHATLVGSVLLFFLLCIIPRQAAAQASFRFISWADTKDSTSVLTSLSNQAVSLNPDFAIYPGDLCNSGFTQSCMEIWKNALNGGLNNGMFAKTFSVRGNHDGGDTAGWQAYYNFGATAAAVGATHYAELAESLTYSFDFGNAHFIAVDVPGDVTAMTEDQISWIDSDLAAAESRNLTHAFLFWHGPIYALAEHCCPTAPAALITALNKHPIVSATFHGHEHVYAYTHIDSSRIPGVTHEFEEFVTGDAGAGPATAQSGRYDYWMNAHGFATVDVSGNTLTVNFYKQGTTNPQKTFTFTKGSPQDVPPAAPSRLRTTGSIRGIPYSIITKGPIIDQTSSSEISPTPSLSKRGIPPFEKGREGGI